MVKLGLLNRFRMHGLTEYAFFSPLSLASCVGSVACAVLTTFASSAVASSEASPSATDRSLAEALFREGKTLLADGKTAEACPKFEESQRLDPGGGTQLLLGLCWEEVGRTASAWLELNEALSMAKHDGNDARASVASEHLANLEARLHYVKYVYESVPDGAQLFLDEQEVAPAAWSVQLPLDPGEHSLRLQAPGYDPSTVRFVIEGEGKTTEVAFPQLVRPLKPRLVAAAGEDGAAAEGGAQRQAPMQDAEPSPSRAKTLLTWGIVSTGVGVAGVGAGAYFGLRAIDLNKKVNERCPEVQCSFATTAEKQAFENQQNQVKSSAVLSTVFFGVGVVGLVTGTVLFVQSSKARKLQAAKNQTAQLTAQLPAQLWAESGTAGAALLHFDVAPVAGGSTLLFNGEF